MKKKNPTSQLNNIDNVEKVTIINYQIGEWIPLPNGMVQVKGKADGKRFYGILFFGTHS